MPLFTENCHLSYVYSAPIWCLSTLPFFLAVENTVSCMKMYKIFNLYFLLSARLMSVTERWRMLIFILRLIFSCILLKNESENFEDYYYKESQLISSVNSINTWTSFSFLLSSIHIEESIGFVKMQFLCVLLNEVSQKCICKINVIRSNNYTF